MKSVFSVIGICYALGLLIAMLFTDFSFFIVIMVCILAVATSIFYKDENRTSVVIGLFCIALGLFSYNIAYNNSFVKAQNLCDKTAKVNATIIEKGYTENGKCTYTLNTNSIKVFDDVPSEYPQKLKLKITTSTDFYAELYENVTLNLQLSKIPNSVYKAHKISEGFYINAVLLDDNYTFSDDKSIPFYSFVNDIKDNIKSKISDNLSAEQTGLLSAIILGDKSSMDSDIIDSFRSAGISHIIVVSGLHLSIISALIFMVLSVFFKESTKKVPAIITIIFIVLYSALNGFSYSVLRSAIMNIIALLSYLFYKKPDALNSLGIAIIFITLFNPLAIGNLSLLMSFSATLGIITLQGKIHSFVMSLLPSVFSDKKYIVTYKFANYLVSSISVSLSATIFAFPITVFVFGKFSLYFLISNICITAIAPLTIIFGLVMILISYIPFLNIANIFIGFIERCLCQFIIWISSTISQMPNSVIDIDNIYVKISFVIVILIISVFFILEHFKIKNLRSLVLLCTAIPTMIISLGCFIDFNSISFYIEYTGNGTTLIEKSSSGTNILLCGGDNYHLSNVIDELYGEKINSLIVMGDNAYYSKYADKIIDKFDISDILFYGTENSYTDIYSDEILKGVEFISDNTELNYGKYHIKPINCGKKNALCISFDCGNILVIPRNSDCNNIPEKFRNVTVAIIQSDCKNLNLIKSENVIMCKKQAQNDTNKYYYTGNGEITLYCPFENEVKIWQK